MALLTFPVLMFQLAIFLTIFFSSSILRPFVVISWLFWTLMTVWFLSPLMFLQLATIFCACYFCYVASQNRSPARRAEITWDTEFTGRQLMNADLCGANFEGEDLAKANLRGANLERANLRAANLISANLIGTRLEFADLRGANLSKAILQNSRLSHANLTNANLNGANLMNADLTGADLTGAKLIGTRLIHATMPDGSIHK